MKRRNFWIPLAIVACILFSSQTALANLVTNGDFETGNFAGWTNSGNTGWTSVDGSAHSGNRGASFGPIGSLGFLTQGLQTTGGDTYSLTFWLGNDGGTPNEFRVSIGGTQLLDLVGAGPFGYTKYTYSFTALSPSTSLQFAFQQNPAFWHLDDVAVERTGGPAATPEPCTMLLFGSGLAGLGMYRRKFKKN